MPHILGYIALIINLYAMSRKQVMSLRILSAIANGIYIFYAVLLNSPPLAIGCVIAVIIHLYQIHKLQSKDSKEVT